MFLRYLSLPPPLSFPSVFFFFLWDRKLRVLTSSGSFPMSEGGLFKRLQVVDFFLILFFSDCVHKWVLNIFSPLLPHGCETTSDSFEAHYWALRGISSTSLFIESALFSWWRRGRGMGIHSHKPSLVHRTLRSLASVCCALTPWDLLLPRKTVSEAMLLLFPFPIRSK